MCLLSNKMLQDGLPAALHIYYIRKLVNRNANLDLIETLAQSDMPLTFKFI